MLDTVVSTEKTEVKKRENLPSRKVQSRVGETDIKQVTVKNRINRQDCLLCTGRSRKASLRSSKPKA